MKMLLIQTAVLLSSCVLHGMAETMNNCESPVIGVKSTTIHPPPPDDLSGLFLNTHSDSQAPCDGTVVAWDFCYYVLDSVTQEQNSTSIIPGVWRKRNNSVYQLVNNSIDLPILTTIEPGVQFVCHHWSLSNNLTFEVKEGDIVGVFVDGLRMVHVLGTSSSDAEIMKAVDITYIGTPVSEQNLSITPYSLYLKAMMAPCTCPDSPTTTPLTQSTANGTDHTTTNTAPSTPSTTISPTTATDETSTDDTSTNEISTDTAITWEKYVIVGLAALIFLLLITIFATTCGLIYLYKRRNGSEPVMIKKMKTGKQKITRILMISQEPAAGQHVDGTGSELGDRDSSPYGSQNPTAQLPQPQSPLLGVDRPQAPLEQGDNTAPISPPPVVFAASFDIEQLSDDNQSKVTFKPSRQKFSHTNTHKVALASDLKRSHSATDALNFAYSNSNNANHVNSPLTASTEYPYVLHAFEVVGKSSTRIGSLPNIMEHQFLEEQATDQCSDENQGATAIFQMEYAADDSNSDADDEPSYSYADRRHMTAMDLPPIKPKSKLSSIVEPAANQDYHYDDYPSAWNPTSQLLVQSITQNSNEDAHKEIESSATLPSNQVSSQNRKQSNNNVQDNLLPPKPKVKPAIKPRKKLAYKVTPNHATLHFSTGMNRAIDRSDQPSSSSLVIQNQGSADGSVHGARLVTQTPPTYMKLIETTKDDYHRYTHLFDGATESNKQLASNLDPDRAHPNEWCEQTSAS